MKTTPNMSRLRPTDDINHTLNRIDSQSPNMLSATALTFSRSMHTTAATSRSTARLWRMAFASLLNTAERHKWRLYSYRLMPDHLHFVSALPESAARKINAGFRGIVPVSILDHIAAFKRYTTTQLWWKLGGYERLWQRSSYDRVIWHGDSPEAAIHYVPNNPVRAGLVEDWRSYPYSGTVDSL